jgi:outer membrane protein
MPARPPYPHRRSHAPVAIRDASRASIRAASLASIRAASRDAIAGGSASAVASPFGPAFALALVLAHASTAYAQGAGQGGAQPATPATPAARPSANGPATTTWEAVPPPDKGEGVKPEPVVLTLAAAERAALQAQPQLRAARAQTAAARGAADIARSPLLPQVIATAQYLHEWGSVRTTTTSTGASVGLSNQFDVLSLGISATQLIYDFGQTSEKWVAARSAADAQRYEEDVTRLNVVSGVRQAYFNARAAKDLVDVALETLANQNKHLAQVQAFVQVGTQPEIALAQQKAAVANAKVQLISSQNVYETDKAALNEAAGLVGGTAYDVVDEEEPPIEDEDQPLETLVQKALGARPELANLWKQEESQHATIRAAKGGYGPSLAVTGGASESGLVDDLGPNINVGATLTWPLFQGGLTVASVHQAEANLSVVDAERDLAQLQIQQGVNTAQLAVRAAKETIDASEEALVSAREQLRLAEQRYATGVGSIIELDDAQVAYTAAAAQSVEARYSLATARVQLLAALGRT